MTENSAAVVVVTYNRKELLSSCVKAVFMQTVFADKVFIIDNASTDGTREHLLSNGWLSKPGITFLQLNENLGGAGGFAAGINLALSHGADWIWMMDDDAAPHPNALEELLKVANDPKNIYGSLAVNSDETSWLTTVIDPALGEVSDINKIPKVAVVQSLPFLGFMVHRDLVARIGLPDAGFFIAADDVEYCIRAQRSGAKIIMAGRSRIEHPKSRPYKVKVLGKTLTCLALPPWKRYYDTRNRLLIARKHYGIKLFTQTIPGSLVRLLAALWKEPDRLAQLHAFGAGFWDGLWGIKGKRHEKWGIK